MDLREAFLRDVADHPADDTPRLVFADWLIDHGTPADAEQARLIQIQCDRAAAPARPRPAIRLAEEQDLVRSLTDRWQGRFFPLRIRAWERGFVVAVRLPGSRFPNDMPPYPQYRGMPPADPVGAYHLLANSPEFLLVRRLELLRYGDEAWPGPLNEDDLARLLDSPYWRVAELVAQGVTTLGYAEEVHPVLDEETLGVLCRHLAARSLRKLDVSTNFRDYAIDAAIDRLVASRLDLDELVWDYDGYDVWHRLSAEQLRRLSAGLRCRVRAENRVVHPPGRG